MLRKSIIALAIVVISLPASFGQVKSVKAGGSDKVQKIATGIPFAVGERLSYDVSWSDFIVAGELTLETKDRRNFDGVDGFHVSAQAESVGIVSAVVFKVKDTYESFLNSETLQPFRAEKHSRHGKKQDQSAYTIDQKRGTAKLSDGREIQVPPNTYDLAGLIYAVRAIDLTPGKAQTFTLLENDKLTTIKIEPEAREKMTTRTGKYDVVRVAVKTVEEKETKDAFKLRIYLTSDARRLPVLISADMSWGEVRAELTSVTGARQDKKGKAD